MYTRVSWVCSIGRCVSWSIYFGPQLDRLEQLKFLNIATSLGNHCAKTLHLLLWCRRANSWDRRLSIPRWSIANREWRYLPYHKLLHWTMLHMQLHLLIVHRWYPSCYRPSGRRYLPRFECRWLWLDAWGFDHDHDPSYWHKWSRLRATSDSKCPLSQESNPQHDTSHNNPTKLGLKWLSFAHNILSLGSLHECTGVLDWPHTYLWYNTYCRCWHYSLIHIVCTRWLARSSWVNWIWSIRRGASWGFQIATRLEWLELSRFHYWTYLVNQCGFFVCLRANSWDRRLSLPRWSIITVYRWEESVEPLKNGVTGSYLHP